VVCRARRERLAVSKRATGGNLAGLVLATVFGPLADHAFTKGWS
jgi:hypothetical protein